MSEIAIQVEGLSKQYRIGKLQSRHARQNLAQMAAGTFQYLISTLRPPDPSEILWALREISFEVPRGEVLGVIGQNGAGKSTLLKVLSRITEPTAGRARIHGRVGSLLEVGTGFHPELTGRENIYLNGAILGMKRVEIDAAFDEIVAFAEVEKFLDTQVKRYSSGMYVRLAFAVAAHLKPEVLFVDEVLAVGDAAFQKKCLGKMSDVAGGGRTILFVSHNMAAVANLCQRVLYLENGQMANIGSAQSVISDYLQKTGSRAQSEDLNLMHRSGEGPVYLTAFQCLNARGECVQNLISGQPTRLVVHYRLDDAAMLDNLDITEMSIVVYAGDGSRLANLSTRYAHDHLRLAAGRGTFICDIPRLPFRSGRYQVDLYLEANGRVSDWVRSAAVFDVEDGDYYGTGKITQAYTGSLFLDHTWELH